MGMPGAPIVRMGAAGAPGAAGGRGGERIWPGRGARGVPCGGRGSWGADGAARSGVPGAICAAGGVGRGAPGAGEAGADGLDGSAGAGEPGATDGAVPGVGLAAGFMSALGVCTGATEAEEGEGAGRWAGATVVG